MKKPYLIKKAYCDGKLQKDDVMSVNLVVNKAPVAVGTAALSSEDMYMSGKDLYQVEETLEKLTKFQLIQLIQIILIFIFSISCLIELKFCEI